MDGGPLGFSGYITGFDARDFDDREAIRADLGFTSDEKVCIVTVGGSGVGEHLLRRVVGSLPHAIRSMPELRVILIAGPRIDPDSLPRVAGLEVHPYVHNLYRHLAVCDVAVVQGGLTTSMELTANSRPFLYFPLRHHSNRTSTCTTDWVGTRQGDAWTSISRPPKTLPRPLSKRPARGLITEPLRRTEQGEPR
jgi:UDP-N-acetylglucosamine:LPS N-acetylglucosamine transferase